MSTFSEGEFGKRPRSPGPGPLCIKVYTLAGHLHVLSPPQWQTTNQWKTANCCFDLIFIAVLNQYFSLISIFTVTVPAPRHPGRSDRRQTVGQTPAREAPPWCQLRTPGCLRSWPQLLVSCSEEGRVGAFHLRGRNPWILVDKHHTHTVSTWMHCEQSLEPP